VTRVSVEEATGQLAHLIEEACRGEEVVITHDEQTLVRLTPIAAHRQRRRPGSAKGVILHIAEDFDAPLEDLQEYS
jgi:antitoxin (DNA-binding transcriptional repressor) of toxin-antitoxin stability system